MDMNELFADAVSTASVARELQNTRVRKDGEGVLNAFFLSFKESVYDTNSKKFSTVFSERPPEKIRMIEGPRGSFPGDMNLSVLCESMPLVENLIRTPFDGSPGYEVWTKVSEIKKKDAPSDIVGFLSANVNKIWHDPTASKNWIAMRPFVTEQGVFNKNVWHSIAPMAEVTVKFKDGENCIFRKEDFPAITRLSFFNVEPEMYLTLEEKKIDLKDDEMTPDQLKAWEDAKKAATEKEPAKRPTRSELQLKRYFSIKCKGGVSPFKGDESKFCVSERLTHYMDRFGHHPLAPVPDVIRGERHVSQSVYFYVADEYQGVSEGKGVCMVRHGVQDLSDYLRKSNKAGTDDVTKLTLRFNWYQWEDMDIDKKQKYNIHMNSETPSIWLSFGITNPDAFANIIRVSLNMRMHVFGTLIDDKTFQSDINSHENLDKTKSSGFYFYYISRVFPDYFRYFLERGMQISSGRVQREFAMFQTENRVTKAIHWKLEPPEKSRPCPMNSQGLRGAVLSLGNGQVDNPSDPNSEAKNISFKGDIASMFAPDSPWRFFVMTSKQYPENPDDPKQNRQLRNAFYEQHFGPSAGFQDEYLDELINKEKVYYWIFAVNTKHPMSGRNIMTPMWKEQKTTSDTPPMADDPEQQPALSLKRPAPEEAPQEADEQEPEPENKQIKSEQ
jgi:hypothetical protein